MLDDWFKTSLIRTVLPVAWGALVTALLGLGVPPEVAEATAGLEPIITAVVIGGWYAVTRAYEHALPSWLRKILFGSEREPEYYEE